MKLKRIFVNRLMISFGDSYWNMTLRERLTLLQAIMPTEPEQADYRLEEMEC